MISRPRSRFLLRAASVCALLGWIAISAPVFAQPASEPSAPPSSAAAGAPTSSPTAPAAPMPSAPAAPSSSPAVAPPSGPPDLPTSAPPATPTAPWNAPPSDPHEASPNVGLFGLPAGRGHADAIAGPEGFGFLSKDNNFGLLIHWLLQADIRRQLGDLMNEATRQSFAVSYAGVALTARFYKRIRSELLVSFADSNLSLSQAWVDANLADWLHFKGGKFSYPISFERITAGIFLPLVDASLSSALLPSADTGIQAWGRIGDGVIEYNVAFVNGATAGAPADDIDVDQYKDGVVRVIATPLLRIGPPLLRYLTLGVGGSAGVHHGTPTAPQLPKISTWGGLTYVAFRNDGTANGTAVATGQSLRFVPQMSWRVGPLSAYAEYVRASDDVRGTQVMGEAWSLTVSAVPTGEDSVPLHYVVPKHNFDITRREFGGIELTASVGSLRIDAGLATNQLSPAAATRQTRGVAGGVNWYPNLGVRVMLDLSHTEFTPFSGFSTLPNETLLVGRAQVVL